MREPSRQGSYLTHISHCQGPLALCLWGKETTTARRQPFGGKRMLKEEEQRRQDMLHGNAKRSGDLDSMLTTLLLGTVTHYLF